MDVRVDDFTNLLPNLEKAFKKGRQTYKETTPVKIKMLDNLIILAFACFLIQVLYGVFINRDPFNSFIAGVFCSLGTCCMTASFRIQLTNQ